MSFGKILKQLRESNGYSMDKLVELYNIKFNGKMNKSTLSRYENELQEPMFTVIVNLAKLFNVTVDYLSGNDCMDKEDSEAIKSLGYIHRKEELSPELEALNTLLHSYGEQILKTNGNYYFGEFSLTEEEINDFLNTAITMLNGVADVVKKRKQKEFYDFLSSKSKPQKIFRAARSADGTPPEIIDRDDALMDKLKKAPKVTCDEDL